MVSQRIELTTVPRTVSGVKRVCRPTGIAEGLNIVKVYPLVFPRVFFLSPVVTVAFTMLPVVDYWLPSGHYVVNCSNQCCFRGRGYSLPPVFCELEDNVNLLNYAIHCLHDCRSRINKCISGMVGPF
jgi:hypothetical protein